MMAVARLFEFETQAQAAASALLENGFNNSNVVALTPAAGSAEIKSALRAGGFLGEHASFYADQLAHGRSLVVVSPPFGMARLAEATLKAHNPLALSHEPAPEPFVPWWERATPLSDLFGLPVLSRSETPFSDFWGFSTKQYGLSHFSRWFKPLAPGFTLSEKLGLGFATASATPLSSMLGMPTKSNRLAGKNSSFGIPLVAKRGGTFSSLFGLPLLTKRNFFLTV
jgi:hypothetical protein